MAELDNGIEKKLITDKNLPPKTFKPQYMTDIEMESHSSKEAYFRWLSRLVMICAILSLGMFLSASLVIFRLAPEIIVEPLLIISQSDSENMVRYEPITTKMPSLKKLTELFVKQYVILRNTVMNRKCVRVGDRAESSTIYLCRMFIGNLSGKMQKALKKCLTTTIPAKSELTVCIKSVRTALLGLLISQYSIFHRNIREKMVL